MRVACVRGAVLQIGAVVDLVRGGAEQCAVATSDIVTPS